MRTTRRARAARARAAKQLAADILKNRANKAQLAALFRAAVEQALANLNTGPPTKDLDELPIILTLPELAALLRVAESTIRRALQDDTFVPRPWARYPYRWRRADVKAHLKRRRKKQPHKSHGFAARRPR